MIVKTQKQAERKFMKRLEAESLSEKLSNQRYNRTQIQRRNWTQIKGTGKVRTISANQAIGNGVRALLRVGGLGNKIGGQKKENTLPISDGQV